ncbi:CPBP family intramembrane glutamic endopeptidase [Clostridium oryzae]|uniref:CAAX amino terminal protease self-immunity n=1 Tax=Clostridium oryzae TaxID=1450648 RepID=A0A1V4ISX3_9CLOT|nr:CPBP family intramembrane glutamic endopeptidase [Clostridium oryzae]OPJ62920.1 CAAX amino terminal protease self- immunity [Clostridium oryzae]
MKKDIRIVIATILIVLIMGTYKLLISAFLPTLDQNLATLLRKLLQAATVIIFITSLKLWKSVGIISKISKKSVILLLPVIILSFTPLLNGFNVENCFELSVILITAVLIGVIEELEFRGIVFGVLKPRGSKVSILTSSLLFGLAHLLNLFYGAGFVETVLQIIFAVGFGFIVAVVRYKTDLILPQIIVHALWDFNFDIANTTFNQVVDVIHSIAIGIVIFWGVTLILKVFQDDENKG